MTHQGRANNAAVPLQVPLSQRRDLFSFKDDTIVLDTWGLPSLSLWLQLMPRLEISFDAFRLTLFWIHGVRAAAVSTSRVAI